MAWRGRGRGRGGRGGFGGGLSYAKQEPFVLFPENENLPDVKEVAEELALVRSSASLQKFWSSSAYYLKDEGPKKEESLDIEKYSDRGKSRTGQKNKLSDFIMCTVDYVPAELAQDSRPGRQVRRKVNWHQDSDLAKLDLFEKLENKYQGQDEKDGKGKKEDEYEQEDEEGAEEDENEYSTDGEYEVADDVEDGYDGVDDEDDGGGDDGETY